MCAEQLWRERVEQNATVMQFSTAWVCSCTSFFFLEILGQSVVVYFSLYFVCECSVSLMLMLMFQDSFFFYSEKTAQYSYR